MASGLRKARVLKKNLPPVIKLGDDSFGYLVRHRVISEDRNRFSAWSPVQAVPAFDLENQPETVTGEISFSGDSVTVVWDDALDRPSYDIFVSFDEGPFEYHGTSPIHSYSFLKPSTATLVSVTIQIESIDKLREDVLTIVDINATIGS
jgi:hypothetical protein